MVSDRASIPTSTTACDRARRVLLCSAVIGVFVSCSGDARGKLRVTVRDSAGITIVEHQYSPGTLTDQWRVLNKPVLEIGTGDGAEEYQFFDLKGAIRLSDGRIVVANGGSGELRYFDAEGVFLLSVGGEGEGPGEFRFLSFIARLPGDSVLTYDDALLRIQIFDSTGRFVRSLRAQSPWPGAYRPPKPVGVLNARTMVAILSNARAGLKEGLGRLPNLLATVDLRTGRVDSLQTILGVEQIVTPTERGVSLQGYTFGSYSDIAAGGNRIVTVDTELFSIDILDAEGTVVRKVRKETASIEVTAEDVLTYIEETLEQWPPGMSARSIESYRRRIRDGPVARFLPFLSSVELDSEGNIWVEAFPRPGTGPAPFFVFGLDGRLIAEIHLPPGLDRDTHALNAPSMDIGSDYVLGVWNDDSGVEYVRLYELTKSARVR